MEWLEGCGTLCVRSDCIRGVKKENEHRDAEAQRYLFLVNQKTLCLSVSVFHVKNTRMKEADYYISNPDGTVVCMLCPHQCKINEDTCGRCRSRMNRGGHLYSLAYAHICAMHVDPVEKKVAFLAGRDLFLFGFGWV